MSIRPGIKYVIILLAALPLMTGAHFSKESPAGMAAVRGGCFTMGYSPTMNSSPSGAIGNHTTDTSAADTIDISDAPPHTVCISDFFIDKYEVRQVDYQKAMDSNPSKFVNSSNPVDSVTWNDAQAYCEKLGKRLPTEAEWEYAAREGGKDRTYPGFDSLDELDLHSWNYFNSPKKEPHPPGMKKPNSLGLFDMAGNVFEWTTDWYSRGYYNISPKFDPRGPSRGRQKVIRGGSWCNDELEVFETRHRSKRPPETRDDEVGFRCAMDSTAK